MRTALHNRWWTVRAWFAVLLLCALLGAVFHGHPPGHDCPLCQSLAHCAAEPLPDLVPAPMVTARPLRRPVEMMRVSRTPAARRAPRAPPQVHPACRIPALARVPFFS